MIFQQFSYDELGNVKENYRTFTPPILCSDEVGESYTFKMNYDYDSWGRTKRISYPDGETVLYRYNLAGDLFSMEGLNGNEHFKYIDSMHYNILRTDCQIKSTYCKSDGIKIFYNNKMLIDR